MSRPDDGILPPKLIGQVLEVAGEDTVLIGGQALAFWMVRYQIAMPPHMDVVSRDLDFSVPSRTDEAPLKRFATAIGGTYGISHGAMSQLVGVATVRLDDGKTANVDVLWKVKGFERGEHESRAIRITDGEGRRYRIMHPLDVLWSRCINLHEIADKQDEVGQQQYRLAIEVARAFIEAEPAPAIDAYIRAVIDYSKQASAKKNAERYGLHLADAIPAWLVEADDFWDKEWRHVGARMSPDHAALCEERAGRGSSPSP